MSTGWAWHCLQSFCFFTSQIRNACKYWNRCTFRAEMRIVWESGKGEASIWARDILCQGEISILWEFWKRCDCNNASLCTQAEVLLSVSFLWMMSLVSHLSHWRPGNQWPSLTASQRPPQGWNTCTEAASPERTPPPLLFSGFPVVSAFFVRDVSTAPARATWHQPRPQGEFEETSRNVEERRASSTEFEERSRNVEERRASRADFEESSRNVEERRASRKGIRGDFEERRGRLRGDFEERRGTTLAEMGGKCMLDPVFGFFEICAADAQNQVPEKQEQPGLRLQEHHEGRFESPESLSSMSDSWKPGTFKSEMGRRQLRHIFASCNIMKHVTHSEQFWPWPHHLLAMTCNSDDHAHLSLCTWQQKWHWDKTTFTSGLTKVHHKLLDTVMLCLLCMHNTLQDASMKCLFCV